MGSPCPPHWTFAARAAYFGDRICAFCDHRNPNDARFCNACASPLHLKPCKQCEAINNVAATACHSCAAAFPVPFTVPAVVPTPPTDDVAPAFMVAGDAAFAPGAPQPASATPTIRAGWRLLDFGPFHVAAIAAIVVVGAYEAYRVNVAKSDTPGVAFEPVLSRDTTATTAGPAVPEIVASTPVPAETIASVPPRLPAAGLEPQHATGRKHQASAPLAVRQRASQRPAAVRHPAAATKPAADGQPAGIPGVAGARASTGVPQATKAAPPDPSQLMRVSLATCDGDLIARIVCDQRVRRGYCEGRWGETPECASGIPNDHGQ
jgi:hypothetical protein